jgi:Lon protease-like protein
VRFVTPAAELIPLFPLSHVLVPGMPLPLHICEPRYRQLLRDVRSGSDLGRFGVVVLHRGAEAGPTEGLPDVADVGTLAEIVEVELGADGTSDLLAVGSRRFRVAELVAAGTPYLRGAVEWLPESDGELRPAQIAVTRRLCADVRELLEALTGQQRDTELPSDANLLSYHVAASLPLGTEDRQSLLAAPTAAHRLRLAVPLLRRELRLLQGTRSVPVAPTVLRLPVCLN